MNLVIGATGVLGREVCRLLRAESRPVRALIRPTSNTGTVQALKDSGVDVQAGDLKRPETLKPLFDGVRYVVSTASSTLSRAEGDSIDTVDRQGQLNLIEAARKSGVEQFVYTSFPATRIGCDLQDAKRTVESAIRDSGVPFTILQTPHFWEIWFSQPLGFDVAARRARVFGDVEGKMSWVSLFDVARAVMASLGNPKARNRTFVFGGPQALSQRDVIRAFEKATGHSFEVEVLPLEAIREQHRTATDPLHRSFAALMLICSSEEWQLDNASVRDALGIEPRSAEAFVKAVLDQQP